MSLSKGLRVIGQTLFMGWTAVLVLPGRQAEAAYTGVVLYPLAPAPAPLKDFSASLGAGGAAGKQVVGSGDITPMTMTNDGVVWLSTGAPVDLGPVGYTQTNATATDGTRQVGGGIIGGSSHALLWNSNPSLVTDLNPTNLSGYSSSQGSGINGTQQVGFASGTATGGSNHAMLWNGAANTAVDLDPGSAYNSSFANGTSGTVQVGYGSTAVGNNNHALLWTGTGGSFVDLEPTNLSGFVQSIAYGAAGGQQVGFATGGMMSGSGPHAILWTGAANTAVDLSPTNLSGFSSSIAFATNGTAQVGYGNTTTLDALLWTGSGATTVDLGLLLPPSSTWVESFAESIDAAGNVFGTAVDSNSNSFAVEWTVAVPEPACVSLLAIGAIGVFRRGRAGGR